MAWFLGWHVVSAPRSVQYPSPSIRKSWIPPTLKHPDIPPTPFHRLCFCQPPYRGPGCYYVQYKPEQYGTTTTDAATDQEAS
eukprot:2597066-Rhodomonas_salina.2